MKRVLAVLVDAFRYDYLSQRHTPFLYSLAGTHVPLRPILGYSDAIRATIFTGTYPTAHNYWMGYRYSPETSPFGVFRPFAFVDRLPAAIRPWAKLAIGKAAERLLGGRRTIRNTPIRIAHLFDYTLQGDFTSPNVFGHIPTVFDVLRGCGQRFSYIDSAKLGWRYFWHAASAEERLLEEVSTVDPEAALVFVYLHYLDNTAHRRGTASPAFLRELSAVDSLIGKIVARAEEKLGACEVLIFSDHGMADATSYIDFEGLMREPDFGRDYFFVLDSTMVRLWYLDDASRERVRTRLDGTGYGHFLTGEDKRRLHLDFEHRYYGDDIYLVDPPLNIYPNSISLLKPLAMHAYHPELESQKGIFIFRGGEGRLELRDGFVHLVDIVPTLLRLLELGVPETVEGTSLVR